MSGNVLNTSIQSENWLERAAGSGGPQLRVVIVEDVLIVRKRIATSLSAEPELVVVGEAGTCQEAQALLLESAADVLVCDIGLPGTPELRNGIELIAWALKRDPQLRAVVLTNYTDEAYRRASLRAGASAFLDKSTEFADLPEAIRLARR